jgi:hypothetical protein
MMFGNWRARGTVLAGGAVAALVFAAAATGAFSERSKRISVNGGAEPSATIKCPRGTEALSAGFVGTRFNETALQRLERVTRRKFAYRFQNQTPTHAHVELSALCREPRLGLVKETTTGTVSNGDSLTATCSDGMKAVSGGVSIPEPTVLFVQAFLRDARNSWTATFYSEGRPEPGVKVSVLCADHPGPIRPVTKTRTIPGGTHRSVTARCDRDERVVSGGWFGEADIPGFTLAEVFGSSRNGRRAWTSAADSVTPNSAEFTTFAYCIRR